MLDFTDFLYTFNSNLLPFEIIRTKIAIMIDSDIAPGNFDRIFPKMTPLQAPVMLRNSLRMLEKLNGVFLS